MRGQRDVTLAAAEKICRALNLNLTGETPAGPQKAEAEGE
jgi:hypothetical protein